MRKLSLLLVALLVISTGAFAQVTIEPEISVEASATFGVNLDEETTGLSNAAEATLSFTIVEEATEEFGSGEVYGWIELEDFKVEVDSTNTDGTGNLIVNTGSISAKLFLAGPMVYIDILSATSGVNEASNFSKIAQNIATVDQALATTVGIFRAGLIAGGMSEDDADAAVAGLPASADVSTSFGGPDIGKVALGFDLPDLMTIEFGVLSAADWNDNNAPDNWYMLSLDAEITAVPDLSIALVATMELADDLDPGDDLPAGFGVGFEYTVPISPDMDLIPALGFDYFVQDTLTRMEFGFGLNLSWAGIGTDDDEETLFGAKGDVTSGVGLGVVFGIHDFDGDALNTLGVKVGLFEDGGDDGLLPVIGGALVLNYNMVMGLEDVLGLSEDTYFELGLGVQLSADLGVIEPYAGLTFLIEDLADDFDANESYMYLNVGTDISVISNTTFTVDFKSGELLADEAAADVIYGGGYRGSARESGQLTIRTKISF